MDLPRSAQLFEQLMLGRISGVALVDPQGEFLRVNPALCEFFDRTPEDLIDCTWQELTHPDDLDMDLALVADVLDGRRDEYRLRKRYLRSNGEVLWGDLSVACLRKPDGSVDCLIAQIQDVTELLRAQERYRLVVENSSDVVLVNDDRGTIRWVSPNVEQVCGYRPSELIGRDAFEVLVAPQDRHRLYQRLQSAVRHQQPTRTVFPLRTKTGSFVWVEAAGQSSAAGARVVRWRNIDAEHRAVQRLRDSEQLFRTAMAASAVGMATLSLDREFTQVNEALCQMVGRDHAWLVGRSIACLLDGADDQADQAVRAGLLSGDRATTMIDKKLRQADGQFLDVRHAIGLLRDEQGQPTGYVSQFVDMTEVNRAHRAVEFLAAHDALTQVRNRRGLMSGLESMLGHPPRTGRRLGLMYIDLDGFKELNDRYGHPFGDRVLEAVAGRLREAVRSGDLVGRLGGDEFVIVLEGLHGGEEVGRIAKSILCRIAEPLVFGPTTVTVTASAGLVLAQEGEAPQSLLQRADSALYRSKRDGGDTVTIV